MLKYGFEVRFNEVRLVRNAVDWYCVSRKLDRIDSGGKKLLQQSLFGESINEIP